MGVEVVDKFLEADMAFKKEGNTYRVVKNRNGQYPQGLSQAETELYANGESGSSERPFRVFYG